MHIAKIVLAAFSLSLALASNSSLAAQLYTVSAKLSHNGKLIGSPSLVVKEGTDATVAVSGPSGYKLVLNVTDAGHGPLTIVAHLDTAYGSIAPSMVVLAGQPATVSAGQIAIGLTAVRSGT